ncbi:MAG: ribonuclease E [Proteobacteria bacterium]|nr:MAG: ribonuclease E [Pseudomonadota bacterium]
MADSKKEEASQGKVQKRQIKATTGAWWKSTVAVVTELVSGEKSKPDSKKKKTASRKSGTSARKKTSGKRPAATKKNSVTQGAKEDQAAEAMVQASVGEEGDTHETAGFVKPPDSPETVTAEASTGGSVKPQQTKKTSKSRGRRGGRKKSSEKTDNDIVVEKDDRSQEEKAGSQKKQAEEGASTSTAKSAVVKLLINAEEPEECRLALLEDGRLESIHVNTVSKVQTRNNIYKARIVAIEPNLQAAFIDYGTEKNGFLPFNEIHPEYYKQKLTPEIQKLVDAHQWKKLNIADVLEKGQELLVQVVKEEIGTKGANMTTYLSLPGRCVVLMPGSDSEGISRRISGEERRNQLREAMNSLNIPEGIGWIVRTASIDITKTALQKDVRFLLKLWKEIKGKGQKLEGVGLLYQDYNCVMRFLREYYDPCIQEILVDDLDALEKVRDFISMLPAKQRNVKIKQHRGARPIFNQYSVEDQIESIYQPKVNLPSGGSIVIDQTEALVAIDVNSGSTGKGKNFEETIFQANMEAAAELARQLRLRDLGGLVVVDFIDMRSSRHIKEVERKVKAAMKRDKAKTDISRISRFGLMQISQQKLGAPIESGNYHVCEYCRGRGTVRSVETQALFYFRRIHTGASRRQVTRIDCRFPMDVAEYLLNNKRYELIELEEKYQTNVMITADPGLKPSEHEITFVKNEKEEVGKNKA